MMALAIFLAAGTAVFVGAIIIMVCRDLFDVYRDRRRRRNREATGRLGTGTSLNWIG
jgi:4-hydroxybenzoate polyprenyltransferase